MCPFTKIISAAMCGPVQSCARHWYAVSMSLPCPGASPVVDARAADDGGEAEWRAASKHSCIRVEHRKSLTQAARRKQVCFGVFRASVRFGMWKERTICFMIWTLLGLYLFLAKVDEIFDK